MSMELYMKQRSIGMKTCEGCGETETEQWYECEIEVDDPISVSCSDIPMTYIPVTVNVCNVCYCEGEFQSDGPWNYE